MKALICPNEPIQNGYRIAQVESDNSIFPVAEPMYWMDCSAEVVPDVWYYDPADQAIKENPVYMNTRQNQPTTTGSQTL
jgi:hypothetical protein